MRDMPTRKLDLKGPDARGYWYTDWTDEQGKRRKKTFGSKKRRAELRFAEFAAQWQVDEQVRSPSDDDAAPLTVSQLWDRFYAHAQAYYRDKDGQPTREATNLKHAMREVVSIFGDTEAASFDASRLKRAREAMVKLGLCRSVVNQRVRKVRQVFRWAHGEGMIPGDVVLALESVKALAAYRTKAKETEEVTPVADVIVEQTLAHCPPTLAAMIRIQRLTGMRPGEVCIMRMRDIDTSGLTWLYRPHKHKLDYLGRPRVVKLGPKSRAIIEARQTTDLSAYLFSPRQARHEREVKSAGRIGRASPRKTDRRVGSRYTTTSYYRAVQYACKRADVAGWSPNQLRHAWATEALRNGVSLDVIAGQMGHSLREAHRIEQTKTTLGYVHVAPQSGEEYINRVG